MDNKGNLAVTGNSFANGPLLPKWATAWEFQLMWQSRTTIWTVMP
jgi:hypothetical protein